MLGSIPPIPTVYKNIQFRSRLEARWAVFFDLCNAKWEYETRLWQLNDGTWYLPDFIIHDLECRVRGDLYVEVKGVMGPEDKRKILGLADKFPVLVLGNIPSGDTIRDIEDEESSRAYQNTWGGEPYEFNFETIDGDHFAAHLGIDKSGRFSLFGDDCNYTIDRDDDKTLVAYRTARDIRFQV